MHVCSGTAADADGNTCTWAGCAYNSIAPNQYFGRCQGTTAGALCVCGQPVLYVDAATGLETNAGTNAAPYKTITKALGLAASGQTVQVRPGSSDASNGESFPLQVPNNVSLIGDETTRGAGSTTGAVVAPTKISGGGASPFGTARLAAVVPGAGVTVAGFVISSVGSNAVALAVTQDGSTFRNDTLTGCTAQGMYVGAKNLQILLDAVTNNGADGLFYANGAAGSKVENSTFTGNQSGITYGLMGGDAGGGSAGSVGNNVFSCNASADINVNLTPSTTVPLANNKWDHVPPQQNGSLVGCDLGQDLCVPKGNANPVITGASASGLTCPTGITP